MREIPRTTNVKVLPAKTLLPDCVRKKPPISNLNKKENIRESVTRDISSSRPNSTASSEDDGHEEDDDDDDEEDDDEDDDDDEENDGTTECSGSYQEDESTSSEAEVVGGIPLDPISEEASLIIKQSDEENGYFIILFIIYISKYIIEPTYTYIN